MHPVDAEVGEEQKQRELQDFVPQPRAVGDGVVHFGVAADFAEDEGQSEEGHAGEGGEGLFYFEADLVFEVFWVFLLFFVEDEYVGERGEEEVDDHAEDPVGLLELGVVSVVVDLGDSPEY